MTATVSRRRAEVEGAASGREFGRACGRTIAHASSTAIRRSSMSSRVKSRRAARPGRRRAQHRQVGAVGRDAELHVRLVSVSHEPVRSLRRSIAAWWGADAAAAPDPTPRRSVMRVPPPTTACSAVRPSWSPRRFRQSRRSSPAGRRHLGVHRALGAGSTGELGGLVDQLVQLGVLLEVRRLEVVGPQHPEVVLDQLGALLLDQDRAGAEVGVVVVVDLGDDRP